ncbi:MAG TPA: ATP-binding protein [Candidatus Caccousia avistercoris]|nr:ATP-binding protein [Candidatus Caccousia avistercoris]
MRELALNVMDVAQNSISAGASLIQLTVEEDSRADRLSITLEDNGCGMTEEQVKSVVDPFYTTRTTRKVGLGVPLFKMEAEMTGGSFAIRSQKGKGTVLTAVFVPSHVDMIPLGDIGGTVHLLITCNPERDFVFRRRRDGAEFALDTRELRQVLGESVPLNAPEVSQWIQGFLEEQTALLEGGN